MDRPFPDLDNADWGDVEQEALHCPVLHAAVTVVRQGQTSRERALIAAARARREWLEREAERIRRPPARETAKRYFVNDIEVSAEEQGRYFREGLRRGLGDCLEERYRDGEPE